ncbi:hypothetical protein ACH5RR_006396 [Cinchona calisaya]|uniref:Uncharacterized protein n=1 Tax=Cinchona calisaya TaxID=153742 RepID=A0ABD3ANV6_9GENT
MVDADNGFANTQRENLVAVHTILCLFASTRTPPCEVQILQVERRSSSQYFDSGLVSPACKNSLPTILNSNDPGVSANNVGIGYTREQGIEDLDETLKKVVVNPSVEGVEDD